MSYTKLALGLLLVSACAADAQGPEKVNGTTIAPLPLASYAPVTDAVLRHPDPSDWIMMRGNYEGWGFSSLDQINKTNVKGLQLVWARAMETGINEATPIIHNGVMFLGNPNDVIQAIDAASGDLLWEYRLTLPSIQAFHNNFWGQRIFSIDMYYYKIYTVTRDNFLLALDAKTGKALWEFNRGGDLHVTNTTGPIVVNGVVIAGSNCQEAAQGCYVTGNNATTNKKKKHNTKNTIRGEPGDETWGGMPFEQRWMTGVWGPITYDPELNLAFYGSSGVGPSSDTQRGVKGVATLAGTNTRFAVDPKTGKIVWKHQVLTQDNADQECTFEMMPITTKVAPDPKAKGMMATSRGAASASRRTLTGVPCKTSIMWSFAAAKGDFLWAKSAVYQDLVSSIDPKGQVTPNPEMFFTNLRKTYHQFPSHAVGRDWPFAAYSPQTNVMYEKQQKHNTKKHKRADNI